MITEIKSTHKSNRLEIRWALSNVCNFKCAYCFPGSNEGNQRFPTDLNLLAENFNHMFDYYKKNLNKNFFDLKILGGEPTLWKDIEKFIPKIKERHNVYVSIITNGSRTLRWWQKNGHLFDNVILSYHQKFGDLQHMIDVADILYAQGKKVTVHVLMDPTCWDQCVSDIEHMKKYGKHKWMIQTKEVVSTHLFKSFYSESQRTYLQKELKQYPSISWLIKNLKLLVNGNIKIFESTYIKNNKKYYASPQHYITTEQNNFKGWQCAIGLETIYIEYDGLIKGSCGQSILDNNNILDSNFKQKFKPKFSPVICKNNTCSCPPETHVTKKKL